MMKYPDWAIGPFIKPVAEPVLTASPEGFDSWAVYNPAVVFWRGKYWMFYRAESRQEADTPYMGTSRIGLATSIDGVHFEKYSDHPVLDATLPLELPGGCEDPRICFAEGKWHMLYSAYHYPENVYIFHAVSDDLIHWEKKGSLLKNPDGSPLATKSAAIVCRPDGTAAKIKGKYWLYTNSHLAWSADFVNWETKELDAVGFTGSLNEVCVALTDYKTPGQDQILLFFAGNLSKIQNQDYFYAIGEALFSREDPEKLLDVLPFPVIEATLPFEKTVDRLACVEESYKGTIFLDSVFQKDGTWYAYYGCADQFVGLSVCETKE